MNQPYTAMQTRISRISFFPAFTDELILRSEG